MWSGKTNDVLKHLLIADHLDQHETRFSSKIIHSSSVGEDDKTYSKFKKALKTLIAQISPSHLKQFLNENLRVEKKSFVIYKFVMNDFKDPNNTKKKNNRKAQIRVL
jgi:hypothetical protein